MYTNDAYMTLTHSVQDCLFCLFAFSSHVYKTAIIHRLLKRMTVYVSYDDQTMLETKRLHRRIVTFASEMLEKIEKPT